MKFEIEIPGRGVVAVFETLPEANRWLSWNPKAKLAGAVILALGPTPHLGAQV